MADFHWNDIKDRMPPKTGFYLVTVYGTIKNRVEIDYYFTACDGGAWDNNDKWSVIAWAEIPQAYEGIK